MMNKRSLYFKKLTVIFSDIFLFTLSFYVVVLAISDFHYVIQEMKANIVINYLFFFIIFYFSGIYENVIRYLDINFILKVSLNLIIILIFNAITSLVLNNENFIRLLIPQLSIFFFLIITLRVLVRNFFHNREFTKKKNIIIYGAGNAGIQLALSLSHTKNINIVAFIDDDEIKQGRRALNILIYSRKTIKKIIEKNFVDEIYIAIPSLSISQRKYLLEDLSSLKIGIKSLPHIERLIKDEVNFTDLKNIDINDLVERKVNIDHETIRDSIKDKVVLITGSGGSIGSELCAQCLNYNPKKVIAIDLNEYNLYELEKRIIQNVKRKEDETKYIPFLLNITEEKPLEDIFLKYKPQIVFHAAAYKHVKFGENNPISFIKNNIFGTMSVCKLSIKYNCESFTLVSTDKAVRPKNIMGITKRVAEIIVKSLSKNQNNNNNTASTRISIVRFGNVIGSSGSVIPLFQKQIETGGPVTVTDSRVTRYFMTIPEAVGLILLSKSISRGNEVYVLDMGEPLSIENLAKKLIHLAGKIAVFDREVIDDNEIKIEYTGLIDGEKLHEELLIGNDTIESDYSDILIAKEKHVVWTNLEAKISNLKKQIDRGNINESINIINEIVLLDKTK